MKEERLDKLLAAQGSWSRREIKDFVRRGAVTVNGKNVRSADIKITTDDEVIVFGKPVVLRKHLYLMLNKPMGVVSASRGDDCPTVDEQRVSLCIGKQNQLHNRQMHL